MKLFETHCHLDFKDYDKDRYEVINKCRSAGVEYFINVGIDTKSIQASIEIAKICDDIFVAAGYHPNYVDDYDEGFLRESLKHHKVVALGEIGLDYYRNYTSKELQKKIFEEQILIAKESNLPLVIHNRNAQEDCEKILNKYNPKDVLFHCFAGDLCFARRLWDKGWYISVNATLTYKNCKINDIVQHCPLDRLMIETDCPFLAPQSIRGKRNDPTALVNVVKKIAEIKGLSEEIVVARTYINAHNFFLKKA